MATVHGSAFGNVGLELMGEARAGSIWGIMEVEVVGAPEGPLSAS